MRSAFWLVCTILLLAALPVFANTYTYTGNDFTQVFGIGGYTTSDHLYGYIETPSALMPGQTYYLFSLPAFSFTDGVQTIDQSNATSDFFILALDNNGVIYNWTWDVQSTAGIIGSCAGNGAAGHCVPEPVDFGAENLTASGGNVDNNPGHWTAGTVPEPGSSLLLGIGALVLLGLAVRPRLLNPDLSI